MTDNPPKIRFKRKGKEQEPQLRDKDNADHTPSPPSWSSRPAPNLAPAGMGGIKRNLPPRAPVQPARPRFTLGETGKLKKEFKPIAGQSKDLDRDH